MSRSLRGTGRADGLLDLRMPTGAAAASPLLLIVCSSTDALPGTIRIYVYGMYDWQMFPVVFGCIWYPF